MRIIDAFIRKLCKNLAKTRESRNFSETVQAAHRVLREPRATEERIPA